MDVCRRGFYHIPSVLCNLNFKGNLAFSLVPEAGLEPARQRLGKGF